MQLEKVPRVEIVGDSPAMREVDDLVRYAAPENLPVLILGESGTGKELVAKGLHTGNGRRDKRFAAINCAAIPENLLESELFGHMRGAFTGATHNHVGRFVEADEGTVFLDEIGDMPLLLQGKLLRFLEDHTVRPVGGNENSERPVNVRIVSATHQNLVRLMREGRFRDDLYHRLSVLVIRLPPLRDRQEDLPILVGHFLTEITRQREKEEDGVPWMSPEALELLRSHPWPGNVRELRNVMTRCSVFCRGPVVLPEHVQKAIEMSASRDTTAADGRKRWDGPPTGKPEMENGRILTLKEMTKEAERSQLLRVLRMTNGNKSEAARVIGIGRKTVFLKCLEHGINDEEM